MYHCNLLAGEKFYLRLLLTMVYSLQSFEHLCTINSVIHDIFREAAIAMGLTHDNRKWIDTFTEAITFASGESLQRLLITALVHGGLADAVAIWNQFQESFCDDLQPRMICYFASLEDLENPEYNLELFLLNNLLLTFRQSLKDYSLPLYQH